MELTESTFDTGELPLHVMEGPQNGPPLVLLHGSTSSWKSWNALLPQLIKDWHVFAVDLRGHGLSGRVATTQDYHLSCNVRDTVAFLRDRVGEKAILYGHSWGAVVTMLCGGQAKEFLSGVVLEDPPLIVQRGGPTMDRYLGYFNWALQAKRSTQSLEEIFSLIQRENPDAPAEQLTVWTENIYHTDTVYLEALTVDPTAPARGLDYPQAMRDIACPILLLQADPARSGVLEEQDLDMFIENARSLDLVYFPGVGHQINAERTGQVLDLLRMFKARINQFAESGSK
ncbi:MAG TPA: alpha/beta hydrolase [Anaerolineaceae bacterium]